MMLLRILLRISHMTGGLAYFFQVTQLQCVILQIFSQSLRLIAICRYSVIMLYELFSHFLFEFR